MDNHNVIFQRSLFACDVHKDQFIIVAGGIDENGMKLSSVVMFDVCHQAIVALPDLPFSEQCYGAILNDFFYCVESYSSQMYRMCLSTHSGWRKIGPIIQRRLWSILSDNHHLYLLHRNHVSRYDLVMNSFAEISLSMPTPRFLYTTVVLNDKIYCIGGYMIGEDNRPASIVEILDIKSHSWNQVTSLPKPLYNASATIVSDRWIVVIGGEDGQQFNQEIYVFDILHQQWDVRNNIEISVTRVDHKCVTVGTSQSILCIGGRDATYKSCPLQVIRIKQMIPYIHWERIKYFILLRRLVKDHRACLKIKKKIERCSMKVDENDENIMRKLVMDVPLDILRNILTFLM